MFWCTNIDEKSDDWKQELVSDFKVSKENQVGRFDLFMRKDKKSKTNNNFRYLGQTQAIEMKSYGDLCFFISKLVDIDFKDPDNIVKLINLELLSSTPNDSIDKCIERLQLDQTQKYTKTN